MMPGENSGVHLPQGIELWEVSRLRPYERNARTHSPEQVAKIAASIQEFGFTNPILVDGEAGIIAGHGRLAAALQLGLDRVPVIELAHLTPAQRRAYVIADNRLALDAGWDDALLAEELRALQDDNFELALTGFSDDELADLLADTEELPPGDGDEDVVPEVRPDPITRPGDVWLLGKHRVMCGDSTSVDAVETLVNGASIGMVFTDPPYGVDYEGINNDDRAGLADLLQQAFANCCVVAKPGTPVYVFHSDRCADIFHGAFRANFHFSSMIVWVKPSLVLSQTDYQSKHEPCMYGWIEGGAHAWHSDRKQTSVWEFGKERVEGHTTPKPVDLVAHAIENSSKKGQVVFDPFGGSGSTLIACEKTKRIARLMELDPKYCDVIVRRWQDYTGKRATLESTGEPFPD